MAFFSSGERLTHDRLFSAATEGNLELFKELAKELDNEEGIAKVLTELGYFRRMGALHCAASGKGDNTHMCKYLVEELKLDVNDKDEIGDTPLLVSARIGKHANSVYLLEHGADPKIANDNGFTPLHFAAREGDKDLMQLLISKGAQVDAKADLGTPLHGAACHGDKDSVEFLLKNNANPNCVSGNNFTPLINAILSKSAACVRVMIKLGADPNTVSCACTPLVIAANEGESEIITCLLNAGADANIPNYYDLLPIEIAAKRDNIMDVMTLFPATSPIACVPHWSIRGVLMYFNSVEAEAKRKLKFDSKHTEAKVRGAEDVKRGRYKDAINWYTRAMSGIGYFTVTDNDATLLSNRSLCWARLNKGGLALGDALACIRLREDWPKAHYRAGMAWQLLQDYKKAADEFYKALKLDPNNKEIQHAYRESNMDYQAVVMHQMKYGNAGYAEYSGYEHDEAYEEYISGLF